MKYIILLIGVCFSLPSYAQSAGEWSWNGTSYEYYDIGLSLVTIALGNKLDNCSMDGAMRFDDIDTQLYQVCSEGFWKNLCVDPTFSFCFTSGVIEFDGYNYTYCTGGTEVIFSPVGGC